jgi:hypothetical protein
MSNTTNDKSWDYAQEWPVPDIITRTKPGAKWPNVPVDHATYILGGLLAACQNSSVIPYVEISVDSVEDTCTVEYVQDINYMIPPLWASHVCTLADSLRQFYKGSSIRIAVDPDFWHDPFEPHEEAYPPEHPENPMR